MSTFAAALLGAALVDITWRSTAIVAFGYLVLRVTRPVHPATRRAVWALVQIGIASTLFTSVLVTGRRVADGPPRSEATDIIVASLQSVSVLVPKPVVTAPAWAVAFCALWLAGSLAAVALGVLRALRAYRTVREATTVDERAVGLMLGELCERAGLKAPPALLQTTAMRTAAVYGVWRPTLLIGASFRDWDAERQRQVIAHELAHIATNDLMLTLLARSLRVALWWNPAIAFAAHCLAAEQEYSCDEQVLAGGARPDAYAETLLDLSCPSRVVALAPGLNVAGASIADRVAAVLAFGTRPSNRRSVVAVPLMVVAAVGFAFAPTRPAPLGAAKRRVIDVSHSSPADRHRRGVSIRRDASGAIVVREFVRQ